jgi:hypothetical protein
VSKGGMYNGSHPIPTGSGCESRRTWRYRGFPSWLRPFRSASR